MAVIIHGIDIPKKHYMNGYYISDDGKVFDVSRKNVVGKAVQISSIQFKIIRCKDCKHHRYDADGIPYCINADYGYGWRDDDYCSKAELRGEQDGND